MTRQTSDPRKYTIHDVLIVARAIHGPDIARADVHNFTAAVSLDDEAAGLRGARLFRFSEVVAIAALVPFAGALFGLRHPDLRRSEIHPEDVRELWIAAVRSALLQVQPNPAEPLWLTIHRGAHPGDARGLSAKSVAQLHRRESHPASITIDLCRIRQLAAELLERTAPVPPWRR